MSLISWMMSGARGADGLQTSGELSKEAFVKFSAACMERFESPGAKLSMFFCILDALLHCDEVHVDLTPVCACRVSG
jgi:hypothetical protein